MSWSRRAVAAAVIAIVPAATLRAQGEGSTRAYLELGGHGLAYSVNFERDVGAGFDLRLGLGGVPLDGLRYGVAVGMLGWQPTNGTHALHVGAGAGVVRFDEVFFLEGGPTTTVYGTATVGYRYQPRPRGLILQIAFTPLFVDRRVQPWVGVAIGRAF